MAMPMDYNGVRSDDGSERTDNVNDYKITCMDFIKEISHDYEAWVDYYKLPEDEDKKRRAGIRSTIERTNEWIAKVAQTIKAVDVVMNDGIQKMAESTVLHMVRNLCKIKFIVNQISIFLNFEMYSILIISF